MHVSVNSYSESRVSRRWLDISAGCLLQRHSGFYMILVTLVAVAEEVFSLLAVSGRHGAAVALRYGPTAPPLGGAFQQVRVQHIFPIYPQPFISQETQTSPNLPEGTKIKPFLPETPSSGQIFLHSVNNVNKTGKWLQETTFSSLLP